MANAPFAENSSLFLPSAGTIVKTQKMTEWEKLFEIKLEGRDLGHKPGQFVEVSIPGIGEAPISVSSSPTKKGSFEMVIRNVGVLTDYLHRLNEGEAMGIRGPYGTNFPMEELKGKDLLFIAGGIGLVPMRSAINYALDNRDDYGKISIIFGCKDPAQRLFTDELAKWNERDDVQFMETVDCCDEQKWDGNVGVITTLLPKLEGIDPANTTAFVVGPPVMYKFVLIELDKMNFKPRDIVVSLERRMKCGVGKCGHCQINGVYVCQDGPVFTYESIKELTEAL